MSEVDGVEEALEELFVVYIGFDDENPNFLEEALAFSFEAWIVVVIEVIEADDAVAAAFECD